MTLLDELATNADPWVVMERIVAAPPENIVAAAGKRYARAGNEERRKLIQLVGRLKVLGVEDVLRGWLRGSEPDAAADLLHALKGRGATIEREEIVRLLDARTKVWLGVTAAR